jgi:ribosomal protein S18 acetylase RimI-like enzyme
MPGAECREASTRRVIMTSPAELSVTMNASPDDLEKNRQILLEVYEEVYHTRLGDPFFSTPRYWERLQGYASRDGFGISIGWLETTPIGYTLGYSLPEGSGWWRGLRADVEKEELVEDGHRTFALTEMMVRASWRRRGYARQLHDRLLSDRKEQRATLLVRPDNAPAKSAYISWGWRKLGEIKPFDDSPTYDAMILPLRSATSSHR